MPCFTAVRAEIALMSGSAFAVTHHAFSSGAGRTSDGNGSHWSTSKTPSYTKSVSWQHHPVRGLSSRLYYRSNASASQRRQYSPVTLFLSSKRELLLFC
ncbi:hypothetical protein AWP86_06935 [Escherichia coli]|nr:hypothetical protein AWP86_08605 [Escherichia coli]OKX21853.1 hypothetical protein AWP86_06935 [Escherichia coli]